ncbi:uncharacterized protein ASPGLDRAFT_166032 [Aspergillus glaucus CBS 516.65]|uniref:Uncharacterized protein n=1 Tax=Aspergillus glaucus CBS 516.65 TaxID=1160497 RepID=A0A1L9VTT4_ASPGL|nr:hypothetical protein ASPGLDRAFT_166032 [Aspergillus glaucus CBS 516.65]OJJ87338.1 hypothetical protein ASPGLDRAFT_166032 [Aspergillus glaucus CBS 516.65]
MNLSVAIINDPGSVFKHWALAIPNPDDPGYVLLQARGSDRRFRYEPETARDLESIGLVELVKLCRVDAGKTIQIKDVASKITIRNDISGWNCQDYVLDLLGSLEGGGIIDGKGERYKERRAYVQGKVEGLA